MSTNLTTSIDEFKADLEENGATVRITNRYETFCEEHYSTYKLIKKKIIIIIIITKYIKKVKGQTNEVKK